MSGSTIEKAVAIIPARFASQRFPGKVIVPLAGKPLVYHTYLQTCRAKHISRVIVATDDSKVVEALQPYDVEVIMTRPDHLTGTDRIAEVAKQLSDSIIVNVQGDEPLVDPDTIDRAIEKLHEHPETVMATARHALSDPKDIEDPNVVKVVVDTHGRALYFSRYPIPYVRAPEETNGDEITHWQHIGLYVFRREFLLSFPDLPPTPLELLERLEQLRVLENGYSIAVVDTEHKSIGVDTPADLERAREILEKEF
ncbi:MAG: 3-deoxy-manno-octulosonate cytidylyltransferase [Candidatus Hydrogenedentota bacterium]|nr:MAG: 3-deoxy-manno-octulosonate cytidylyltransferase [Candidatus Hydrogenedentota bacterium]